MLMFKLSQAIMKTKRAVRGRVLTLMPSLRTHQIYGVGTGKSGTHSIASMFQFQLHVAHEPAHEEMINHVLGIAAGCIDHASTDQFLLERDRRLGLELDSSGLNHHVVNRLAEIFPHAKFILTIREPLSWLDSAINHQLANEGDPAWRSVAWRRYRDFRFRPDLFPHPPQEVVLKERNLYSLDGYFSAWAHHNRAVLDRVPPNRLFVIRTDRIGAASDEIAAFIGVPKRPEHQLKSHAFKNPKKFGVLQLIDQDHLQRRLAAHCSDLVDRFFTD
jgi:hypothetical protein